MARIPLPEGHHTVTPGFVVEDAKRVIAFLQEAFGGVLTEQYDMPGGKVGHAEVRLGDSVVMMGDAMPGYDPMPASLSYYVEDGKAVDATYARALKAGATGVTAPKDQFYGYRTATVKDPGGNKWHICAVIERLTPEEISRRMASLGG